MKYKVIILILIITVFTTYKQHDEYIKKDIEKNKIISSIETMVSYNENDKYPMVLDIPKLSLKKGIYLPGNPNNNIEKNITIHEKSILPDQENSNLILLAHSGTGPKAYFNDLVKLEKDYFIYIYYNYTKYIYILDNSYEVEKNGKALIKRNEKRKSIVLITCSQKNKNKQLIYIGYLIDEITY